MLGKTSNLNWWSQDFWTINSMNPYRNGIWYQNGTKPTTPHVAAVSDALLPSDASYQLRPGSFHSTWQWCTLPPKNHGSVANGMSPIFSFLSFTTSMTMGGRVIPNVDESWRWAPYQLSLLIGGITSVTHLNCPPWKINIGGGWKIIVLFNCIGGF